MWNIFSFIQIVYIFLARFFVRADLLAQHDSSRLHTLELKPYWRINNLNYLLQHAKLLLFMVCTSERDHYQMDRLPVNHVCEVGSESRLQFENKVGDASLNSAVCFLYLLYSTVLHGQQGFVISATLLAAKVWEMTMGKEVFNYWYSKLFLRSI